MIDLDQSHDTAFCGIRVGRIARIGAAVLLKRQHNSGVQFRIITGERGLCVTGTITLPFWTRPFTKDEIGFLKQVTGEVDQGVY